MKRVFLPVSSGVGPKPVAYVGPAHIRPEARKHLTRPQKWEILERQRWRCKAYGGRIQLYSYANCDADHVIGVRRGGKTVPVNMQPLCVRCRRNKSARELRSVPGRVDLALEERIVTCTFSRGGE